jgi:hypothetical protein
VPFPSQRFRTSLALGFGLLALTQLGLFFSGLEAVGYFGGWRLAKKFELARALGPVEILALGASHADTGFDAELVTRASGRVACNFGVGSTDLYVQSVLFSEVLLPLLEPRTVVWALADKPFLTLPQSLQYRAAPVLARARLPGGHRLVAIESGLAHEKKRRLGAWLDVLGGRSESVLDRYGQTELAETMTSASAAGGASGPEEAEPAPSLAEREALVAEAYRAFEHALEAARARGIRVLGVLMPHHASAFAHGSGYRARAALPQFEAFRQRTAKLLEAHGGVFVNLRFAPGLSEDDALFSDYQHLTAAGAARLAELLLPLLEGAEVPAEWRALVTNHERRALQAR